MLYVYVVVHTLLVTPAENIPADLSASGPLYATPPSTPMMTSAAGGFSPLAGGERSRLSPGVMPTVSYSSSEDECYFDATDEANHQYVYSSSCRTLCSFFFMLLPLEAVSPPPLSPHSCILVHLPLICSYKAAPVQREKSAI